MTTINDGEMAFPGPMSGGMTLRDWFAGQAPIDLIEAITITHGSRDIERVFSRQDGGDQVFETLARLRYAYADAMIAARGETK